MEFRVTKSAVFNRFAYELAVLTGGLNRTDKVLSHGGLYHVAPGPGIHQLPHHVPGVVLGNHQDLSIRQSLSQVPGQLQAIHPGHTDVGNYDIGKQRPGLFQGFFPVLGLCHYRPAILGFEKSLETLPYNCKIVREQDAKRHPLIRSAGKVSRTLEVSCDSLAPGKSTRCGHYDTPIVK